MIDFFEFSNEMLCLANEQGYFTRVNPAWTKTLGWSADELTSRPFVDFVHPDDLAATIQEAELLQSGSYETIFFENRYRCRDGSYRWLSWRVVLEPGTRQLVATARDITEQKLQAQALLESEERFRLLANRAPIGIAQADAEGSIFFANSKWCEMAGVTAEEALGFAWKGFIHPEDLTRTFSHWQSSLQAGQDMPPVEFRFLHRNGDIRWASSSSTLLKDAAGKITGQIVSQQDITERKEAENALRESEERFRLLSSHAPIGIAQANADGSVFFANNKWCELAGTTPQGALGFAWKDFIHPDDLPGVISHWQSYLQAGQDMPAVEFRFVHSNSELRWVSSSSAMLKDAAGKVVSQIASLEDVTKRKAVELRFRGIYEQAPLGIALIDSLSGRFLQINPKYEEIIGRTESEMMSLTFQDITHQDDLAEDLDKMILLRQGTISHFHLEKRLLRGDGTTIWVNLTVVPMWRPGETPAYHMAMVEDITERKAIQDALKESEERFQAFMSHSPALKWAKDEQGRYVYMNKVFEEFANIRPGEWLGKTDFDYWSEEDSRHLRKCDQQVLATGKPLQIMEQSMFRGNRDAYFLKTKFVFRDSKGRRFVGGVGFDVTEQRRAEQALRTEQELLRNLIEVQEQEKQFLCHEFHDGLIQYAFGSAMLLESCRSNPQSADNASKIDMAIDNLRRGVEDGRRVIRGIRPAVLDDSGLEAALEDLVGQFASSGMHVTSKCDPRIGRLPESIQTTVYRVVQEALNNAKKHSGTDVVRIDSKKVNGDLHLEVRDFGCGFDVETARKKGFGLMGMTERVRLLGGECQIQSELDAGTRISVCLPIPTTGGET